VLKILESKNSAGPDNLPPYFLYLAQPVSHICNLFAQNDFLPDSVTAKVGEDVTLDVEDTHLQPEDDLIWSYGPNHTVFITFCNGDLQRIFPDRFQLDQRTGSLTIRSPTVEDARLYECVISNDRGPTWRFNLTVCAEEDAKCVCMCSHQCSVFYKLLKPLVSLFVESFFLQVILYYQRWVVQTHINKGRPDHPQRQHHHHPHHSTQVPFNHWNLVQLSQMIFSKIIFTG
uniref:Ig-like domain-containing protein n=1 Tax=Acanthochromis polyacanthus TaxID=80966 RepID=A0A3Q1ET26_9TELE